MLDQSLRPTLLAFLPRRLGRRLALSKHDEMLLGGFESWRTPLEGVKPHLRDLLVYGDLFILTRLLAWTRTPEPVLVARRSSRKAISWRGPELVLTPFGRRILRELRTPAEAPPWMMGGHEVYGPRTFGVTAAGRLVRL